MMTSSNGNIFRVTVPLCGDFTGPGEFPTRRPVTWSFDVFFDLRLNKRLSKQTWGWWFETLAYASANVHRIGGKCFILKIPVSNTHDMHTNPICLPMQGSVFVLGGRVVVKQIQSHSDPIVSLIWIVIYSNHTGWGYICSDRPICLQGRLQIAN